MPYDISAERRQQYRDTSIRSQQRKAQLVARGDATAPVYTPRLDPSDLMPASAPSTLSAVSLFSGGGGLDLGFDRAGIRHVAAYEILDICGRTLRTNRPQWDVFSGEELGDVTGVNWKDYRGIDIVQGGPPCQPFSIAGHRTGARDPRNMWPAFTSAVLAVKPAAFVAENVPGLLNAKFAGFVRRHITDPLGATYHIAKFVLNACDFGVPQTRRRVFFVGFRRADHARRFTIPTTTHALSHVDGRRTFNLARHALGLPDIGFDALAPTLRSGFTGPRNTTGVVNSKASLAIWSRLQIWPNGVQRSREDAAAYPPENGHHRLAVEDCALLQGFPHSWQFEGAVYQALGQIGNSVAPPVAYAVAKAVVAALRGR